LRPVGATPADQRLCRAWSGPAVITNGKFDPVKINQIAARNEITYEE
jgi:hypothetical protein